MGSLKNPKSWIPYLSSKDCSKRICSIHCQQWCKYIILPSPPPPPPPSPPPAVDFGGAALSPFVIAVIAVLGTVFLLIVYSIIVSRYFSLNPISTPSFENQETPQELDFTEEFAENDAMNHVPWLISGKGLDEASIRSIRVCNYKRGGGVVLCTDCSVCLGEFEENESIRVLPKCNHGFHVYCIDTWLKTHSNCPLCRANVSCVIPLPPPPSPQPEMYENNEFSGDH